MVAVEPGFERVFRDELPRIARTVFLICHDHHLAEDIAEDAFVQLLRHGTRLAASSVRGPGTQGRGPLGGQAVRRDFRRWTADAWCLVLSLCPGSTLAMRP